MTREYTTETFITDWQIFDDHTKDDYFVAHGTRDEFDAAYDPLGLHRDEKVRQYLTEIIDIPFPSGGPV